MRESGEARRKKEETRRRRAESERLTKIYISRQTRLKSKGDLGRALKLYIEKKLRER